MNLAALIIMASESINKKFLNWAGESTGGVYFTF